MRLLRIALMVVLVFLTLGVVIAIGSPETGPLEKIVLGGLIVALVLAAARVQRLGRNAPA
jgi:hypothetical protein